jgi:hypothetical protein
MSEAYDGPGWSVEIAVLIAAVPVALLINGDSPRNLPLLVVLLLAAVAGDVTARDTPATKIKISSSFLAIVTAAVLLGPTPAALIGAVTIVAGSLRFRYATVSLPINLMTFTWFPIVSGFAFQAIVDATGVGRSDPLFYLSRSHQ